MRRRLAATIASVSAATALLTFSYSADAAAPVPIRTYTEQGRVVFTGIGSNAGFSSDYSGNEKVILSPRMAFAFAWRNVLGLNHQVHTSSGQTDIVGDHEYVNGGNGRWTVSTLSTASLAQWARELNPYVTVAKFDALRGIRRIGARHYRVTGTYAQVGSFLAWEYDLSASRFKGSGFTTFTIDMVLDPNGRPVLITVVARSSTLEFGVKETFASYNKPVTISAP